MGSPNLVTRCLRRRRSTSAVTGWGSVRVHEIDAVMRHFEEGEDEAVHEERSGVIFWHCRESLGFAVHFHRLVVAG